MPLGVGGECELDLKQRLGGSPEWIQADPRGLISIVSRQVVQDPKICDVFESLQLDTDRCVVDPAYRIVAAQELDRKGVTPALFHHSVSD